MLDLRWLACRGYLSSSRARNQHRWLPLSLVDTSNGFRSYLYRRQYRVLSTGIARKHENSGRSEIVLEAFKKTLRTNFDEAITDFSQLGGSQVPRQVNLVGYLGKWSNLSRKLSFASLSSPTQDQSIQLVSSASPNQPYTVTSHETNKSLRANSAVHVQGRLQSRQKSDLDIIDDRLASLEICVTGADTKIEVVNGFPEDVVLKPETRFGAEQRNLQLRNSPEIRQALKTRAEIQDHCRSVIRQNASMVEVDTPLLFKSTSEGAREFIVPTRRKGFAYALPQSPQQFKQLLMASGIAGYFQFARCFRDEDLREDRQPEFSQLDLEMAFASSQTVMGLVEIIVRSLWQKFLVIELPLNFDRITYHDAMRQYGSDKPDLRIPVAPFVTIGHAIPVDLVRMLTSIETPIVETMVLPMQCSPEDTRRFVTNFFSTPEGREFQANRDGAPGVFVYDSAKPLQGLSALGFEAAEAIEQDYGLEDGHLLILQARPDSPFAGGSTALGRLRSAMFRAAVADGHLPAPAWTEFKVLWIVDFPLFSPATLEDPGQGGHAGIHSTHHPFTSPKTADDVDLLRTDPGSAVGDHFDLVINGEEIGGGSRRIHHSAMQELIFRDVLKMDQKRIDEFAHLLEALRAGCPPHSGFAIGFDRLVAMMMSCKLEKAMSIRNVIAFPKIGNGSDPMLESPAPLTDDVLQTYHLSIKQNNS